MLEHGANVNVKNKNGLAPFGLGSQGRLQIAERIVHALLHALVQHGADFGGHDSDNL